MKTQIISIVAALAIVPLLSNCEQSKAQPAGPAPAASSFKYTIIRVPTMGENTVLDNYVNQGWEPISIGGGEGMGAGQTSVLLRKPK